MTVEELSKLEAQALSEIDASIDEKNLEQARVKYIGRKSMLSLFLRDLKTLNQEDRAKLGKIANDIRSRIEMAIQKRGLELQAQDLDKKIAQETIDISMPGTKKLRGHLHPLTLVRDEIEDIFKKMGFDVIEGPEVESDWYNFHVLNMGSDHPARDMQDTFWLKQPENYANDPKKHLLPRTHTSNTQVRFMEKHNPPLRIIVPGRIFRNENSDATHEMQFNQFEGLMVGKDISVAHVKGVVEYFFRQFFKDAEMEFRFVTSYFPYTEPSFEIFIKMSKGRHKGKWMEMAGAGMVHQDVFKQAGYVPGQWQGFAWGFGIDRLALLKYNIDDIRLFYSSDMRFLNQF